MIDEDAVTGVTSNPTIFQKAIAKGRDYDEQLKELLGETRRPDRDLLRARGRRRARRVRRAAAGLGARPDGQDGYVSLEVDPTLANKTDETLEQAIELHDEVDRPNVLIKIPATLEGLPAIEDSIARGVSINVTLIFSLERYDAVVEAYIRGLERLVEAGGDPSTVASVASFFVSRIDTETDKRLEALGNTELQGKLGVANAKLAYKHFQEAFAGPRWEALAAKGARVQRPLWASTSTKNPAYRDMLYVEELIGPDTVNTMPPETVDGVPGSRRGARRHGARGLGRGRAAARASCARPASTTTTSSRRSRSRASTSSSTRSTS